MDCNIHPVWLSSWLWYQALRFQGMCVAGSMWWVAKPFTGIHAHQVLCQYSYASCRTATVARIALLMCDTFPQQRVGCAGDSRHAVLEIHSSVGVRLTDQCSTTV